MIDDSHYVVDFLEGYTSVRVCIAERSAGWYRSESGSRYDEARERDYYLTGWARRAM